MNTKEKSMLALSVGLLIILAIKPEMVATMYSSILGRLVLIGAVIFFSMNNLTLGLLIALVIISGLNQFGSFTEGMENQEKAKEKDTLQTSTQPPETPLQPVQVQNNVGVDKEDIKNAIMSKDSKTIPISDKLTTSTEVSASTPTMLKTSKLEGFTSYGSAY